MSGCELRIELDRPDGGYRPGEPVSGRVIVAVAEPCTCKSLTVRPCLCVELVGRRSEDHERAETALFSGDWPAGEHAYPFALEAPAGPADYRGATLGLSWKLRARAELPWAKDAVVEREVRVLPEEEADFELAYWGGALKLPSEVRASLSMHVLLGVGWIVLGGLALRAYLAEGFAWYHGLLGGLGALLLVAQLAAIALAFRTRETRRAFRSPPDLGPDVNELMIGPAGSEMSERGIVARFLLRPCEQDEQGGGSAERAGYDLVIGVSPRLAVAELEARLEVDEVVVLWVQRANQNRRKPEERAHPLHAASITMEQTAQSGVYRGHVPLAGTAHLPLSWGERGGHRIRWRAAITLTLASDPEPWTGEVRLVARTKAGQD